MILVALEQFRLYTCRYVSSYICGRPIFCFVDPFEPDVHVHTDWGASVALDCARLRPPTPLSWPRPTASALAASRSSKPRSWGHLGCCHVMGSPTTPLYTTRA